MGLGDYVAENEDARLVQDYFIETIAYKEALEGRQTIFVGRKGSGKTANLLKLTSELQKRLTNLVCVIKPVGYEFEALVRLFASYREIDTKGYAIASLWKFIIYTEIAEQAVLRIKDRLGGRVSDAEVDLIQLVEQHPELTGDFAIRLERAVSALGAANESVSLEKSRLRISEALHEGLLKRLRLVLGAALCDYERVQVTIDNLDKAWTRQSDIDLLSEFLLGLLTVARQVETDFSRSDSRRRAANVAVSIFLRADIFHKVLQLAREPDKIAHRRLQWDGEMLLAVIEERFMTSHNGHGAPEELWQTYFCPNVNGMSTKSYLLSRILKRPRDIIFLVKAAATIAINRRHRRIEAKDVIDAEREYSQYAVDSIRVENETTLPEIETILLEFAGQPATLDGSAVNRLIERAGVSGSRCDEVVAQLLSVTFLGVEVSPGYFAYSDDPRDLQKNAVLAARLAEKNGRDVQYRINTPFHAYLEVLPNATG